MGLVVFGIGLPAASPADALLKVGLFLLFVGACSGSNPLSRCGKRLARRIFPWVAVPAVAPFIFITRRAPPCNPCADKEIL